MLADIVRRVVAPLAIGRRKMASFGESALSNGTSPARSVHTLEALKWWSSANKALPEIAEVKHLHVYDFDNTLFASPLPNKQVWRGDTVGKLQTKEVFANGGWWHDLNFLACTGDGVEKEERRAWDGWWNEEIVRLVELSMQQKDALNVLLTGRSRTGFADLVTRIFKSKQLDFDVVCLKPPNGPDGVKFTSTMQFKQAFLSSLINTYRDATEIRIYEDRPRHVQGFRDFLNEVNDSLVPHRERLKAEVIEVSENAKSLDPTTEITEVQRMINTHNAAFREGKLTADYKSYYIKSEVLFIAYLISPTDTDRLLKLIDVPALRKMDPGLRLQATSILIGFPGMPPRFLDQAGGIGRTLRWRIKSTGSVGNDVFAARVEPVPSSERYFTKDLPPRVVLALRRNAKPIDSNKIQSWTELPRSEQIEFETVVGEKSVLSIEAEQSEEQQQGNERNSNGKRSYNEDFPALGKSQASVPRTHGPPSQQQTRNFSNDARGRYQGRVGGGGNKGGFGRGRSGARQGGNQNRGSSFARAGGGQGRPGGRGRGGYKSLDDNPVPGSGRGRGSGDGGGDEGGLSY